MTAMNMIQALNSALDVMLTRDANVLIFGEDVGFFGGVFRVTDGLQQRHGEQRVFDAPIAESGQIAVAIGMGAYGLRPVVECQFADYIYPAFDQLVSEAARLRYRSAGEFNAPITVRAPYGGGPHHNSSTMFEDVYKEMPCHLREQQAELVRFRVGAGKNQP